MIGKKGGENEKMGLKKNMELSKMGQIIKLVQKLSKKEAEQKIHEISLNSKNVIITDHAKERMEERGFVTQDLFGILREGYVDSEAVLDKDKNNWKYKITKRIDTIREAGVVTAIVDDYKRLVIITIEWEVYK